MQWITQTHTLTALEPTQISVVNTPGDYKGHWIDILPNGGLSFNRTVDFESIFTRDRGGARPHSAVIFDLTDPENPIYY